MNKEKDTDKTLFEALTQGITPLKQDKLHFSSVAKQRQWRETKAIQRDADSFFSDIYQPHLPSDGPMRWSRADVDKIELKRLRRGDYQPDLLLDLHGMRQNEAKLELTALIHACIKTNSRCCSVMHGHGSGTLKQKVPLWLSQHPHIEAFHQAPKRWGGAAALLVLVQIDE